MDEDRSDVLYRRETWRSRVDINLPTGPAGEDTEIEGDTGPTGYFGSDDSHLDLPDGPQGESGIPLFSIPPIITRQERSKLQEGRILDLD